MSNGRWLCLTLLCVVGCKQAPVEVPAPPVPATLDEVIRRTQLAFSPEGRAFTAGVGPALMRVDDEGLSLGSERTSPRLGAPTVGREGREPLAPGPLRRRADGALLRESAGVTELLQNTEAGLAQSWHFAQAPRGSGDLVVRIAVEHARAAQADDTGLHFASGGTRFTYGHGTWIDAAGTRSPVPAQLEGDAVVLRVPAALVSRSAFPAVLDPLISVEQDVEQVGVVPSGTAIAYGIASNGSTALAVWHDWRDSSLMAARVTADGGVLDPWGFRLPLGSNGNSPPAVASDGTDFLIVAAVPQLFSLRLSASGQVLGSARSLSSSSCASPSLVRSGSEYLLVHVETEGAQNIVAHRLGSDGSDLARTELTNSGSGLPTRPKLAVGGNTAMVVYEDLDLFARRLDLNLSLLDVTPIPLGPLPSEFDVAWDGQRFVVSRSSEGLSVSRITTSGVVIDPTPLTVAPPGSISAHAITAEDGGVRIAWVQADALRAARLAPTGAVFNVGAAPVPMPGAAQLAMTRLGAGFLLASMDKGSVRGRRMQADFTSVDPTPLVISGAPTWHSSPVLAWNGTHYLAAWDVLQDGSRRLFVSRLARDGTPLDSSAQRVSPPGSGAGSASVASDGRDWLVAWIQLPPSSGRELRAARVAASGEVVDDGGLILVPDLREGEPVSVAWLGDRYGIVYGSAYSTWPNYEIRGMVVGRDGVVLPDAGGVLARPLHYQPRPRLVAWDGGAMMIWQDGRDGGFDVLGARLGPDFTLLEPGFPVARAPGQQTSPGLSVGPEGLVACWSDGPSVNPVSIRAARLTFEGAVLDDGGLQLSGPGTNFVRPCATTWDGEQFFVVWSGVPNSLAMAGAWLTFDGGLVPDSGVRLTPAGSPQNEFQLSVASQGHRQSLVAFQAYNLPDAGGLSRGRTRLVTRGAAPSTTPATATTPEDTAVVVLLPATDPDGDPVQFVVVQGADSGVVTPLDGGVRYQPAADFHGADLFQVVADDGALRSAPVEIAVTVTPVDDVPVAQALAVTVDEDLSVTVSLPDRDVDGEPLSFAAVQAPAHGTLTGQPPSVVYAPTADYSGADEFTYTLGDGRGASVPARVSITVRPQPDAPVASPATVTTAEDTAVDVVLTATDLDGDPVGFEVLERPARGELTGQPPRLRYTPAPDFVGEATLVFRASDATTGSTAQVRLVVTAVNDAPTATDLVLDAQGGVPVAFSLQGLDPESAPLTFRVVSGPSHGALSGEGPSRSYTADATFSGEDTLTYEAVDEAGAVGSASVRFVVSPAPSPPKPPSCGCQGAGAEGAWPWSLATLAWLHGRFALRRRRQLQVPPEQ